MNRLPDMSPEQSPDPAQIDELRALLAAARAERDRLQQESDRAWGRLQQITSRRSYRVASKVKSAGGRFIPTRTDAPQAGPAPVVELGPCPRGMLMDVGTLDESARSGIARVTVELARALDPLVGGITLVRASDSGLVVDQDHVGEVLASVASHGSPDRPDPQEPPLLVSAAVQPGHSMVAWSRSVDQVHRAGGTYVQIVHDLIPITHPDFFPAGMRRHFPLWLEQVVGDADIVLCDSEATRRDLQRWVAEQGIATRARSFGVITLAPFLEPADVAAVTSNPIRSVARQVLTVGTVEPRKGVECVLSAAQQLRDHQPPVEFTLVGAPGWGSEALIDRLRVAHADPTIPLTWVERVDDGALADLYRSADLVLQPSRTEGFGLPLAEALVMGTPVLARDIPVFREIVTDDASFFATDADLVPALLRRLDTLGTSVAARPDWTWGDSATQLLDVVSDLTPRKAQDGSATLNGS